MFTYEIKDFSNDLKISKQNHILIKWIFAIKKKKRVYNVHVLNWGKFLGIWKKDVLGDGYILLYKTRKGARPPKLKIQK